MSVPGVSGSSPSPYVSKTTPFGKAELGSTDAKISSVKAFFQRLFYALWRPIDSLRGIQADTGVATRSEKVKRLVSRHEELVFSDHVEYQGAFKLPDSASKRYHTYSLSTHTSFFGMTELHNVTVFVDTQKKQIYFLDGKGNQVENLHLATGAGEKEGKTVADFLVAFKRDNPEYKECKEENIKTPLQRRMDCTLVSEVLVEALVDELEANKEESPNPAAVLSHIVDNAIANIREFHAKVNTLRDRIFPSLIMTKFFSKSSPENLPASSGSSKTPHSVEEEDIFSHNQERFYGALGGQDGDASSTASKSTSTLDDDFDKENQSQQGVQDSDKKHWEEFNSMYEDLDGIYDE